MITHRLIAACLLIPIGSFCQAAEPQSIRFNKDIRPILSEHCFACHGPDSASRKAGLRLDTRDGALANGVITPGDAESSELIERIFSDDPRFMMPPAKRRHRLSGQEKQLLRRWINSGAKWEKHWSFIKPRKTDVPQPEGVAAWARNPIDHFVLAKLRELNLEPNAEADRHILLRRAALDLTGLPPDWERVKASLSDRSETSFEQYVDRILKSKHAGEHRARFWLDAARYGDTHGMHVDNYREMWPYRDWVIRAFNSNMPFDQFVIAQIAGDLLPEASLDQHIASGFNRCNITTSEGGAIPEELNVRYMVDRVETTATVFLGMTAGCAVCHDHKYDPITQREFYQFGAFFNNTTQPAMDGNQKDTPPVVTLPKAEFETEWNELSSWRAALNNQLAKHDSKTEQWWPQHPKQIEHPTASNHLALWMPLTEADGGVELPKAAQWATNHPEGKRGIRFGDSGGLSVDFPKLRSDQPLTVSFWLRTPDQLTAMTIFDQTAKTKDNKTVGWKITCNTAGAVTFQLFDTNGKNIRGNLPDNEALRPRAWQHVCVRYSGGQSNSSVSILADAKAAALRNSTEAHVDATELAEAPLKIATTLPTAGMSDIRVFRRWLSDEEVKLLSREFQLKKLLASEQSWSDLETRDRDLLRGFHRQWVDERYRALTQELARTETRRDFIYARSTTTLVMRERSTPPRAWVLVRGDYENRGDEVAPDVPAILPEMPEDVPRNRLGLAKWLVDPEHPLTARVMVNRLWQSVFGVGLVKTSEDFGVMGERPSHPELLDWLAVEFVESGWDINHILKLIVSSATYRQSSVVTQQELSMDAANRFFARGPRLRLDAEVLRDQTLSVSGLLRRDIGGPSVKPYQPPGLWNVVAITGSNTRVFERDSGDALYRRSVYTFWKRTAPPPSMAALNAPTREQCTVRRERTNTPLQALVLMNDTQFVEAARHFAQLAIDQTPDGAVRATWMLERALVRPATEIDVTELTATADAFRKLFEKSPGSADKLIQTGDSKPDPRFDAVELAVWTMVANTIMNRDDFINK